jgi:hypothetical protein
MSNHLKRTSKRTTVLLFAALLTAVSPAWARSSGESPDASPSAVTSAPAPATATPATTPNTAPPATTSSTASNSSSVAKPAEASAMENEPMENELQQLRDLLEDQARQLQEQSQELRDQQHNMLELEAALAGGIHVAPPPVSDDAGGNSNTQSATQAPPSLKIGTATFTPGGFVDIENLFRTTNTQNNLTTNYAAIPFSNTAQGRETEYRLTGQFSRFPITVKDKFGANDMTGYCEADFSGNDATSVYQTVNSHTLRLRLCFAHLNRGKWEILGGQTWSWLTPNRTGLGPMPSDLAVTYNEDQNLGVGLPYTRAAEFRVAYHVNDSFALGLGIEDPDQYIGTYVALPSAFASTVGSQFDNGSQVGAPNLFPDILSKIAYDTKLGGRHLHLEAVGLVTGARSTVVPVGSKAFSPHSDVGGGGSLAGSYELFPNFRFLANAFWSDGGGRYLVADGPQLVLRPNAAGTDIYPSMVHAGAGSAGFEWTGSKKTTLAVYYGEDYVARDFFPDTTNTAHPTTIIGYGGPGSPNTNNRTIQEITFDWIQAFWKSPKYGALQYYTQYSYVARAPWYVAPNAPKDAHLSMVYTGVRFVLPSNLDFGGPR